MTKLDIILSACLMLSVLFNIGVFMYARNVIVQLLSVSEELGDLKRMVDSFAGHLQAVYELESFYGDDTLNTLLQHAISFNEQLETFEYIYSLTEEGIETAADDTEKNTQEA
tara:strand:+ start:226 stop:561 length:336 start_codon:yes stop_codon:yes gene_type:complete